MKNIILFIFTITLLIYACGTSANEDNAKEAESKTAAIEAELALTDSLILKSKDLMIEVKDLFNYVQTIANQQMKADDPIRKKLEEAKNKSKILVGEILKKSKTEVNEMANKVNQYLDSTILISNEINELLLDFASYEDVINVFTVKTMTEVDGDFNMRFQKLFKEIKFLEEKLLIEKQQLMLEIEKEKK